MAKVNLFPDFKEFLGLLNSAGVRYVLLGGYAVIFYGHRRMTDDLDVWIAVDPENTERVSTVLRQFGGFSAKAVRPEMFREKGKVFIFGREPVRIDILTAPSGVEFETAYARRLEVELDGLRVPVINLKDLKLNKAASGRLKDRDDLRHLPQAWPASGDNVERRAPGRRRRGAPPNRRSAGR